MLNIEHFEFDFERVFAHPQTQELFLSHLKKELNYEIAEFVMAVDAFKLSYKTAFDEDVVLGKCMAIYDSFVKQDAIKEINVPNKLREHTHSMIENGKYEDCFSACYDHVSLILKIDIFSRFKRSKGFLDYLKTLDEKMVKQIGTHKSQIQHVLLTPEDFECNYITPNDILLARLLLKDYYHWKLLSASKKWHSHKIYVSDLDFVTDEGKKLVGHMAAVKTSGTIDETANDYFKVVTAKEYAHMQETSLWENLEYVPATDQGYASTVVKNIVIIPMGTTREYIMTSAMIRQPGMIIRIYRTCTSKKYADKLLSDRIQGHIIVIEVLQELSNNQCKQIAVLLNNSGGWLTPSQSPNPLMKLFKPLIIDKAVVGAIKKNWKNVEATVRAHKIKRADSFTDYLQHKKSLDENAQKLGSKIIIPPECIS